MSLWVVVGGQFGVRAKARSPHSSHVKKQSIFAFAVVGQTPDTHSLPTMAEQFYCGNCRPATSGPGLDS
jgi:hypothetical protein